MARRIRVRPIHKPNRRMGPFSPAKRASSPSTALSIRRGQRFENFNDCCVVEACMTAFELEIHAAIDEILLYDFEITVVLP